MGRKFLKRFSFGKKIATKSVLAITVLVLLGITLAVNSIYFASSVSAGPTEAPINQKFEEYAQSQTPLQETSTAPSVLSAALVTDDGGCPNCKLIPEPIDFSYLTTQLNSSLPVLRSATQALTPTYDLRTTNKLTPVRDQGACGSCWAHATYASLESSLKPTENQDYSENNLKDKHGLTLGCCSGGYRLMSVAYLARWSGTINEVDDKYNPNSCSSPTDIAPSEHVQDVIFVPNRTGALDNDTIKQAINGYGAVYTTYHHDNAYYNSSKYSYYESGNVSDNHAVAIVGWDDNYSKNNFTVPPPGDGAFLIKNSWGANWGDGGYFWMSYHNHVGYMENAVFLGEKTNNYLKNYQYDDFGWTASTGYKTTVASMANIFKAGLSNDSIVAASTYFAVPNTNYEIRVYKNVTDNNPISGALGGITTGTVSTAGYHTIKLNNSVAMSPGTKFSIVVKLTTPNFNYPIPIEKPVQLTPATANPGESFISANGVNWIDLTTASANANVALKAFSGKGTDIEGGYLTVSPDTDFNTKVQKGQPISGKSQKYILNNIGNQPLNWSATKSSNWLDITPGSGSLLSNVSQEVTVTINSNADSLAVSDYKDTVNFTNTTNNNGSTSVNINLSIIDSDITPPIPPFLGQTTSTNSSVSLNWTPATDNIGVAGYNLYRFYFTSPNSLTKVTTTTNTTYTDSGLLYTPDWVMYQYKIEAFDKAGNVSSFSNTVGSWGNTNPDDEIAPTVPTNLKSNSQTSSSITLNWSASSDNVRVTQYKIYLLEDPSNPSAFKSYSTTNTTYTVSALKPNTNYQLFVRASDAKLNYSNFSDVITVKTNIDLNDKIPPTTPTNLRDTSADTSSQSVLLKWDASTDNIGVIGYDIYNNDELINTTTATSLAYTVSYGATNIFKVRAYDGGGSYSDFSVPLTIKRVSPNSSDVTPPTNPQNLRATKITNNSISMTWDASTDNVGVTDYLVFRGSFALDSVKTPGLTDTSLIPNTYYTYLVVAYDAARNVSGPSLTLRVKTLATPSSDVTPPSIPQNLRYTISSSFLNLLWNASTDSGSGVARYAIYFNDQIVNYATGTSFSFSNPKIDKEVNINVAAQDAAGNMSGKSATLTIKPGPAPDTAPPSVPQGLKSTGKTASSVSLSWTASTDNVGVTGYNIYRNNTLITTATATSFTDTLLNAATTYTYNVSAFDVAGNTSAKSTSVSVKTNSAPSNTPVSLSLFLKGDNKKTVSAATVVLTNLSTNITYTKTTASMGSVYYASIPAGNYKITASADYYLDYLENPYTISGSELSITKTLTMTEGVELAGKVVNKYGSSLYATVKVSQNGQTITSTKTTNGKYSIKRNIKKKTIYTLQTTASGYATQTKQADTTGAKLAPYFPQLVTDFQMTSFNSYLSKILNSTINLFTRNQ